MSELHSDAEFARWAHWIFDYAGQPSAARVRAERTARQDAEAKLAAALEALKVLDDAVGRYQEVGPLKGVRADLARGIELSSAILTKAAP